MLSTHFESVTGCFVGVWRSATSLTNAMVDEGTERVDGILALRNILLVVCTRSPLLIQFAYFVAISASTEFAARLQTFRWEKPLICTGSEGYEVRGLTTSRFFNETCVS